MREQLLERVSELKSEFDRGNDRMRELDAEADQLRETLLRIAGAVQVITEELERTDEESPALESAAP